MDTVEWSFAQVVGHPGEDQWSQVLIFPQTLVGVGLQGEGPYLWLVVSLASTGDAQEKGAQVLSELEQAFADSLPNDPSQVLNTLDVMVSSHELEVGGVYVRGDKALLLSWNGGRVALKRGDTIGVIAAAGDLDRVVKQGVVQSGDRWLLGTHQLVDEMDDEFVMEVMSEETAEDAGQVLAISVQADELSQGVAGALLYVDDDTVGDDEAVEEEVETPERAPKPKTRLPSISLKSVGRHRRSRSAFSVGVVLLVLLGVSLFFGWRQRMIQADTLKMSELESQLSEIQNQASARVQVDRPGAINQLEEGRQLIESTSQSLHNPESYAETLQSYRDVLDELGVQLSGRQELSQVDLWYSLSLVSESMVGSKMVVVDDMLYVLDSSMGTVAGVSLIDKQGEVVAGGDLLGGASMLAGSENRLVVVAGNTFVEVDPNRKNTAELVDGVGTPVVGMGMFADVVYTIEGATPTILRYGDVSSPTDWLSVGVDLEGDVVDMFIDGDIWVMSMNGAISRYRRGEREAFDAERLDVVLSDPVALVVGIDMDRVFVLDRGNSRVVAYNKSGAYVEQYVWDGLQAASDMALDELRDRLVVLVGEELYEIPLGL